MSQSIAALEEKDKWIVNLTLSTTSGSQGITVSEAGDTYIWRIEGEQLPDDKKVTFKAKNVEAGIPESDVYISYHEGTPAFVAEYTITEGFLNIEIPKTYLVDTTTIQIDSMHVQNK